MKSIDLIKRHEALRLIPYNDTVGVLTVGYGHNLEQPITQSQADSYLAEDYEKTISYCRRYPWYEGLNDARKAVIENMIFNMGPARFDGFKQTIQYMAAGDYEKASNEMLDSLWARQVGNRAIELSQIMKSGEL